SDPADYKFRLKETQWITKYWPKGIAEGGVCHSLISSIDIAPTISDVCKVQAPKKKGRITVTRPERPMGEVCPDIKKTAKKSRKARTGIQLRYRNIKNPGNIDFPG